MNRRRTPAPGLSRPLVWAVLLHVALIVLLTAGIDWWKREPAPPAGQPIEAEVIDPAALDAARAELGMPTGDVQLAFAKQYMRFFIRI